MSLGTKNRLNLIGTTCKAHLREQHADSSALVEEFIAEFEGTSKNADLSRVDEAFDAWMNP